MVREQISLLKFLEELGTNLETTMLGATIIIFSTLSQSFFKLCLSLKRWEIIKIMIGPNLLHCNCSLTVWISGY